MDVEMRLIWFVLAGFLLGFSVSTLWEWLYFRGRRAGVREIIDQDDEEAVARARPAAHAAGRVDAVDQAEAAEAWEAAYRGPDVYLESEEDATAEVNVNVNVNIDDRFDSDLDAEMDGGFAPDADEEDDGSIDFARVRAVNRPTVATVRTRPSSDTPGPSSARGEAEEGQPGASRVTGFVSPAAAPSPARSAVARSSRPATPEIYRLQPAEDEAKGHPAAPSAAPAFVPSAAAAPAGMPAPRASLTRVPARPQSAGTDKGKAAAGVAPKRAGRKKADYPDDLAKIKGIGEVYKRRLYAAGIYTWRQIAETDEETLRAATQAYPSSNADEWAEQAQNLAEKQGRVGAVYTGPPPQELTRIYGIGPVGATTLYRAGICTYAQLAATTPEELAPLFPIAVAGDEPDFAHWIAQARELSQDT